jgi:hypothetical protein
MSMRLESDVVTISTNAVRVFTGWSGPVGRATERLAKETVFRIKALANKKTGTMIAGMHYKKGKWSRGIQFDAGSDVDYTLFVDQGTKPHPIHAKNAPYLVFYWPKVGRVVAFKSVQHPGNKPYKFLERGLERALRMWERGG